MSSDILNEFIEDAREHLQSAGQHILALEKDPDQPDELNGLLRRLHSIKGNSGFLDLRHLYGLLHKAENVLQIIREMHPHQWPTGLVDVLFQVLDTVEIMIQNLENGESDQVDWLDNLSAELARIENALVSEEKPPSPQVADSARPRGDETGVSEVLVAAEPEESPTEAGDFLENIRSLMDRSLKQAGESFFNDLSQTLALFSSRANLPLLVNSERALKILESYLIQARDQTPPSAGSARELLLGLLENLLSWLELESAFPPETADATLTGPVSSILLVTTIDLEDYGKVLQAKIRELARQGVPSPVLDLRQLQVLHSQEIGALISSMKLAPDQKHLGIILDENNQQGLAKVFRVMGLDKIYSVFADENQALAGLTK
jgi:chemotaxis protein histidine kinase CheA